MNQDNEASGSPLASGFRARSYARRADQHETASTRQLDALIHLGVQELRLLHDDQERAHAEYRSSPEAAVIRIPSQECRRRLQLAFRAAEGRYPARAQLNEAMDVLAAIAVHEAPEEEVFLRLGPDARAVVLYPADGTGLYTGSVEAALEDGGVAGPFDTICCYDVLEHLADPEPVLRALRSVAAPGARLHVSIPNARHVSLLVDLLFRGTFGNRVFGHRDATHLRWYTRRDIVALVGRTGWDVQWAIADTFRGRNRYVDRLTLRRARECLALQWHVLARAV